VRVVRLPPIGQGSRPHIERVVDHCRVGHLVPEEPSPASVICIVRVDQLGSPRREDRTCDYYFWKRDDARRQF